ncbi:amidohydrolase family protein [Alcaligenaceae bacterium C4P045]|nr:amidohydrolase family protein [Alcaligenaceae bacterium C4P045]
MTDCRPPLAEIQTPQHALPKGAWDCHCHVFGPVARFPFAADRRYTPPDAPYEKLAALHQALGIARAVIVQAACHGTDHGALLAAIAASGGRYRGVGLLAPDADRETVAQLHAGGIRGVRFNFVKHLGEPPEPAVVERIADLVASFGWHVAVHLDGASLRDWLPLLQRLPVPFVIDHMARVRASDGPDHPDVRALCDLGDVGNAWVKVSGVDRIASGTRPFAEGVPVMRAILAALPERTLWGTDWPHPNVSGDMPDDGELVDTFFNACPDAALRQQVLVDNPNRLFGKED